MRLLIIFLGKAEGLLRKCKNFLLVKSDPQYKEVTKWHKEDPHALKRLTFDNLNPNSIVFDLGGYEGEWTSGIYAHYGSNIYVFEPVKYYADLIQDRFKFNPKIKTFPFGLAEKEEEVQINIDKFSSSIYTANKSNENKEYISLKEFNQFIESNQIPKVDLIKINIEGAEFNLLEHLIKSGSIKNIRTLLIQFHNFIDNAAEKRRTLQNELGITHKKLFDYPFVWECWEIKS